MQHEWVIIGHVHIDEREVERLVRDGTAEFISRDLCDPEVCCLLCERVFTQDTMMLPCEAPAAYARDGEPIYASEN